MLQICRTPGGKTRGVKPVLPDAKTSRCVRYGPRSAGASPHQSRNRIDSELVERALIDGAERSKEYRTLGEDEMTGRTQSYKGLLSGIGVKSGPEATILTIVIMLAGIALVYALFLFVNSPQEPRPAETGISSVSQSPLPR